MAGVRHIAREKWPGVAQTGDDVAAEAVIGFKPGLDFGMGTVAGVLRNVQRNRCHRPDIGTQLEQRPILLERLGQVGRLV